MFSKFGPVTAQTVTRYSTYINRLLIFVIRVYQRKPLQNDRPYDAPLSTKQRAATATLLLALESKNAEEIKKCIQDLMLALWMHKMEDPNGNHLFSAVVHFLILSCVTFDGTFRPSSGISPLIAILAHCGRATFVRYMVKLRRGAQGVHPWP
jgi:hypothetical protein